MPRENAIRSAAGGDGPKSSPGGNRRTSLAGRGMQREDKRRGPCTWLKAHRCFRGSTCCREGAPHALCWIASLPVLANKQLMVATGRLQLVDRSSEEEKPQEVMPAALVLYPSKQAGCSQALSATFVSRQTGLVCKGGIHIGMHRPACTMSCHRLERSFPGIVPIFFPAKEPHPQRHNRLLPMISMSQACSANRPGASGFSRRVFGHRLRTILNGHRLLDHMHVRFVAEMQPHFSIREASDTARMSGCMFLDVRFD